MTTSTDIITKRDNLSLEISKFWTILKTENVVSRRYKRHYDMHAVIKLIESLGKQRIEIKMQSLAINLGLDDVNDLPENSIFPVIYELSELNEMYMQLKYIPTLDEKLIAKYGKKNLKKTEVFSNTFITNYRNNLLLEINALKQKLDNFNAKAGLKNTKKTKKAKMTVTVASAA